MPNENGEYTQEEAQALATEVTTLKTEAANTKAAMEKMIELPAEGATEAQITAALTRIGAVTKPEELSDIAKDDAAFEALKPAFVAAKLSKAQTKAVYDAYMNYASGKIKEANEKNIAEVEALKKEWGADWDPNIAAAKEVVTKLGIDKVGLNQLEAHIGAANIIKMFHTVSKAAAEPDVRGGDGGAAGGSQYVASNPTDAQAKIDALMKDPKFGELLAKGDPAATKQFNDLHKVRYSGGK